MIVLIIKTLVFTFIVPCSVAVVGPWLITENMVLSNQWAVFFGFVLIALGCVLYSWCVWDFIVFGKGTPAPIDAPKTLVVTGLYRYTRNPMYIAVLSIVFGWVFFYFDLSIVIYFFTVAIGFQVLVVFYEEPILKRLFADEYYLYMKSVKRWLPNFF